VSRAVILSGVRTPIGRKDGALSGLRPDDLAAIVIAEAVARAGVPSEQIEDVYFGAANQSGEDNRNVARMAVLLAGLPETVASPSIASVHRGCQRLSQRAMRLRRVTASCSSQAASSR
jgi:acetyl-CoA acetyltransferase